MPDQSLDKDPGSVTLTDGDDQAGQFITVLPRGTTVGRYMVVDLVGQGGMGVVYKAFDPDLNRPVALKLLTVQKTSVESSQAFTRQRSRLLREAQALAQLSHPNVVTVFDVGVHQESVFMAMEYVEGKTLADLFRDGLPPRRELLQILLAAGRGLAAAHKVGIIHRDFKPANVIIGSDGRVRVLDFGLARSAAAEAEDGQALRGPTSSEEMEVLREEIGRAAEETGGNLSAGTQLSDRFAAIANLDSSGNMLLSSLTQAGAVVGTPQYMAPEQHLSEGVDAKSDQFSFCLVLFEALYGARPFTGRSLREMVQRIIQGQIERPAKLSDPVPAWLDRIAERGLRGDPAERYPSMDELLEDLAYDPEVARAAARARRLRWATALLVLGFGAAAAWGIWYGSTRGAKLCAGGEEQIRGVWDAGVRDAIHAGFEKTGKAYAQDTFERVDRLVSTYARDWVVARREACEATHVRGEQSEQLLDRRMQCLDRRLSELKALVALLATRADAEVLDKAVQAAYGLIGIEICADKRALLAAVLPPEDQETRRRVEKVRKEMDEAQALHQTGKYQDGLRHAEEAQAAAERTGYRPILAEAMLMVGCLLEESGRYPEAEQRLRRAALVADSCGHTEIRARALNQLLFEVGYRQARYQEAEQLGEAAEAVLEFYQDKGEILAAWHINFGTVLEQKGDYEGALRHFQEALAIRVRVLGAGHPDVGYAHSNIGDIFFMRNEFPQALASHERALKIREDSLGKEHPSVAISQNNIGLLFYQSGDYPRAREHLVQALGIWGENLDPEHPNLALAHNNLGLVFYELGDSERARDHFERALASLEKALGPAHPFLTEALDGLGWIELRQGRPRSAVGFFERVLAICGADKCNSDLKEALSRGQYGLARALWDAGGSRERALKLARLALVSFQTQRSFQGQKNLKEAELWLREVEGK